MEMICGVIADHVDHRRSGAARVVKIGQAIGQPWPQMQQSYRRFVGHARITIGGAGHDPFKQAKHRADSRLAVDRGDQLHFRRAGVGKTGIDAAGGQRRDKGLSPVKGHCVHRFAQDCCTYGAALRGGVKPAKQHRRPCRYGRADCAD